MSVLGASEFARVLAASSVLLLLLAGCAPQADGGTDTTDETAQGTESGDSGGDSSADDGGDSDDEFVALDPCTIIPDDALTAALGSAPTPDRTSYPGSGSTLCTIESSAGDARLSIEIHTIAGRDGFEIMRGHKEGIEGLYQPLTGIGEDAFAFASEVTVLVEPYVAVLFLEGLAFDTVDPADRLERTKTLAVIVADNLAAR